MKAMLFTAAFASLCACSLVGGSPTRDRPADAESEAYMRKAEEQWAMLGITHDRALLPRILAEDYTGMSTSGVVRDKAATVQDSIEDAKSKNFVSVDIDSIKYSHFGDTVVAQGRETFTRAAGQGDYRLVWTDVWMWRDGQWQVVASHAAVPVDKPAAKTGAAVIPAAPL